MTQRSVGQLIGLTIITFGIYGLVWTVKTKGEMVSLGADIPSSWLLIVPVANILYLWKWSGGVEKVTNGQSSQALTFVLMFLLNIIGMAIVQSTINKSAAAPAAGAALA